jgi:hypothetical protein
MLDAGNFLRHAQTEADVLELFLGQFRAAA